MKRRTEEENQRLVGLRIKTKTSLHPDGVRAIWNL